MLHFSKIDLIYDSTRQFLFTYKDKGYFDFQNILKFHHSIKNHPYPLSQHKEKVYRYLAQSELSKVQIVSY